eukprot:COSAG06_NODE_8550_length_2131_cov_4.139764_1_plen_85_part_00
MVRGPGGYCSAAERVGRRRRVGAKDFVSGTHVRSVIEYTPLKVTLFVSVWHASEKCDRIHSIESQGARAAARAKSTRRTASSRY